MNVTTKTETIQKPATPARQWEAQLVESIQLPPAEWQDPGYNIVANVNSGLLLGGVAGCTSLVLNIIGSVLWPVISGEAQHPLRLIQVYLTFPLGESALQLGSGPLLALGCVLYLITGMAYGVLIVLALSYFLPHATFWARIIVCSIAGLLIWFVSIYLVVAWFQPMLFGGSWIAELLPWWVGMLTHLVFGWTIALLYRDNARN